MKIELPDLTVRHSKIHNPNSSIWILTPLVYDGGTRIRNPKGAAEKEFLKLKIKEHQISLVMKIKEHAEGQLKSGSAVKTVMSKLGNIKKLFHYLDENKISFDSVENIRSTLFEYSEYQFTRAIHKEIKHFSAYSKIASISSFLNEIFEDLQFSVNKTRLRVKQSSRRVMSRDAEKLLLSDARDLAQFCFSFIQNFEPTSIVSGVLPIKIKINDKSINLTPARKRAAKVDSDFTRTEAHLAFNLRVSAEVMIFLGMTIQNQAETHSLKRVAFDFKPLGEHYEIREYKARRGGEVLFKVPKQYLQHFNAYLSFMDTYAPDSEFLFPYLEKYVGYRKRTDHETNKFKRFLLRYGVPWVKPSAFRKVGENILLRLSSSEETASDYANHAVATFRQSYEFPSLQRNMTEVCKFWDENDPLTHGKPQISLFDSPCSGIPEIIDSVASDLPEPDCLTPTGCIGCKHYRDEDSFDYIWGLYSFRFLKIIESSSHRTDENKPANVAIDWVNMKLNWFVNSVESKHQEWVTEAELRIEESDYHPSWARKIEKYEG